MADLRTWVAGARPRTLPAAVVPVVVGSGVAFGYGKFSPGRAVLALVVALALQVGVNYANDYSDGDVILTRGDRAGDRPHRPVYMRGMSQNTGLRGDQNPDNLLRPWMRQAAEELYERAEIKRDEIDVLYIQDATSVWVLQMLEWFGFCEVGEAGPFLESGGAGFGTRLPLNTNGGQLSESYMWGWLHLCEAVRQLRGECGARQVEGATNAQFCSAVGFHRVAGSILSTVPA